jgi:hypothetical protein
MGGVARGLTAAVIISAATLAPEARAYSYYSLVSDGCHERITTEALRTVRKTLPAAAPVPSTGDDEALIADLPFPLDDDMADIAAVTLLLGVRENDLKGLAGLDASDLSTVHGDPDGQREHCLRRPEHDEPDGSRLALEECRGFIRELARHASKFSPDASSRPDPARRTTLTVRLPMAGRVGAIVPAFWVYMGQALHTLQDSFTHTFRTADGKRVTTILNWIDFANDELAERRDGPPHMVGLDQCKGIDDFRRRRIHLATEASIELLRAVLTPGRTASEKEEAIERVLDEYLSGETTCSYDTRWCDAPENAYRDQTGCGCRAAAPQGTFIASGVLCALISASWYRRRTRRRLSEE